MRTIADASDARELAARLGDTAHLSLLLDYDGTLVPFAATPQLAAPDEDLRRLLAALTRRPRTRVEIVSGRDPSTLGSWFGDLPITLRAEHGAWSRDESSSGQWVAAVPIRTRAVGAAAEHLRALTRRFGGLVEHKLTGVAWHYRNVAVSVSDVNGILVDARRQLGKIGFDVIHGNCVVEARSAGAHKGRAVHEVLRRNPRSTVVAIGDDTTDEDMFNALPQGRVGILVGRTERHTAAAHRLSEPTDVRQLLSLLGSTF